MDKHTRPGRSRREARRNKVMRKVLEEALDRLLEECLRTGWYGDIALRASVKDGILQREYVVEIRRTYRAT